jgi:hypothetical protein
LIDAAIFDGVLIPGHTYRFTIGVTFLSSSSGAWTEVLAPICVEGPPGEWWCQFHAGSQQFGSIGSYPANALVAANDGSGLVLCTMTPGSPSCSFDILGAAFPVGGFKLMPGFDIPVFPFPTWSCAFASNCEGFSHYTSDWGGWSTTLTGYTVQVTDLTAGGTVVWTAIGGCNINGSGPGPCSPYVVFATAATNLKNMVCPPPPIPAPPGALSANMGFVCVYGGGYTPLDHSVLCV